MYNTRLDTYGCGCQHDCNYCYARSLLSFRGLWNPQNPSVANLKEIEKVIKKIPKGKIVRTLDDKFYLEKNYEKASLPSNRIKAILKLQDAGFDIAIRLSPLINEYMDFDKLNSLGIKKALVEFLRVNHWIEKTFKGINYSDYKLKQSGYRFLRLDKKKEISRKK